MDGKTRSMTTCPVCASTQANHRVSSGLVRALHGPELQFFEYNIHCPECNEVFVSDTQPDHSLELMLNRSTAKSVLVMLENLSELGIKDAYFERVFTLPSQTLKQWRAGNYSSADLALLRLVHADSTLLIATDKADYSRCRNVTGFVDINVVSVK